MEGSPSEAEAEYHAALKFDPALYEANYFYARFCRAMAGMPRLRICSNAPPSCALPTRIRFSR